MSYRRGIVESVGAGHRVKCRLPDRDNMITGWLDVVVPSTSGDRVAWLPKPGNQVALMLDEHDESGCVLGAIYSDADPPDADASTSLRRVAFADGGVVEYDESTSVLRITMPAGGFVELAGAADFVALAGRVLAELQAIQAELSSIASGVNGHTHGVSGAVASAPVAPVYVAGYSAGSVASSQVRSA